MDDRKYKIGKQVVIKAPDLEVSGTVIHDKIQEKHPKNEALDNINLNRIKEIFLQLTCEVIVKEGT
ncbi:hypothetical protein EWK04_08985 [Salmonella enterica subsp. enterica serovar Java]|uniref:Uncharacterized protein n=2 Tax=Salmonella enterica TaxID=28901 RepID=A0A5T8B6K3_SALER|nr:hypothetical protein [Salmonella enterica subsp. enterica serovar Java]EBM2192479.1 hypothetical protein [Salmonella enterica]HCM8924239.1 hypothetical protein [Salmonella enterica subsp. enterica serovar Paratyphi B]EBN4399624.1 hypothetical protein [Salmonella enterica]ECG3198914.1 hypothetical protein [Salmonella enterica subsp. enterica serovar Java]